VGAVQLEQVETGLGAAAGGVHELLGQRRHLRPAELAGHLVDARPVGDRRRGRHLPAALVQRLVHALPHQPGRALATGVADLEADRSWGPLVHEVREPSPRVPLLVVPQSCAAGGDPALGRGADHLGHHQTRASERLPAQVHEVEVVGDAVLGDVHVHRRDDDPVMQLERADRERLEHRWPRLAGAVSAALLVTGEPAVQPLDELGVADPEVVIGDPTAARHDVEAELQRVLVDVLTEVLEPLEAGLGRPLRGGDDGLALDLVGLERSVQ
jgi:hypothetical protein